MYVTCNGRREKAYLLKDARQFCRHILSNFSGEITFMLGNLFKNTEKKESFPFHFMKLK